MLRKIYGPKIQKVIRGWKKLHNDEFHNLYSSPDFVRVSKLMKIGWVGHVACMVTMLYAHTKIWDLKT
jgi:hypothetical protein